MRRANYCLIAFAAFFMLVSPAVAGGRNPTDYPLRVHIYSHNGVSHYASRVLDFVDGEGRANLFEKGEPRGFDFAYRCSIRLKNSPGYETYMARWKKQDKSIEILLPVMGKPGAFDACELRVEMKEFAYRRHNGALEPQPVQTYQQWMEKHQYDPEHGKNEPVATNSIPTPSE